MQGITDISIQDTQKCKGIYVVQWNGDRSPRGLVLNEKVVGWTNNNYVFDLQGKVMGRYERPIDEANLQKMQISLFPEK